MRKVWISIFCLLLVLSFPALAHSGRTDSSGGHYNHSTGEYHYHHGYSAHQHPGGVCPYAKKDISTSSTHIRSASSSSSSRSSALAATTAKNTPVLFAFIQSHPAYSLGIAGCIFFGLVAMFFRAENARKQKDLAERDALNHRIQTLTSEYAALREEHRSSLLQSAMLLKECKNRGDVLSLLTSHIPPDYKPMYGGKIVYIAPHGKSYHSRPDCPHGGKEKTGVVLCSHIARQYAPCKICVRAIWNHTVPFDMATTISTNPDACQKWMEMYDSSSFMLEESYFRTLAQDPNIFPSTLPPKQTEASLPKFDFKESHPQS